MNVTICDFYKEVTGKDSNTPHVRAVLARWHIPIFTHTKGGSTKTFWKVEIVHLPAAMMAHKAELAAKEAAKPKPAPKPTPDDDVGLMQRMANVEQELRTLNATLTDFVKRFA